MDGRDDSLRRWIVLGQLFPTEGLIGVSETSVDDETYQEVLNELDVEDSSSTCPIILDIDWSKIGF